MRKLPNEPPMLVIMVRRVLTLSKSITFQPNGWGGLPKGTPPREYWRVTLLVVEASVWSRLPGIPLGKSGFPYSPLINVSVLSGVV